MRIIGLLNWYAEQPQHLAELINSMAHADIDHLVAVDGAYSLYPNAQPASTPDQYDALHDTTTGHGISLTIHTPAEPWGGNEVEKKTVMFAIAHSLAEPYEDWLLPLDADELIVSHGDYKTQLAHTDRQVATVMHWEQGIRPRPERRLYQAHPRGIHVKLAHYYFLNGDNEVLWGPQQLPAQAVDIEVQHRPWDRTEARRQDRETYYEQRLQARAEAEV